MASFLDNLQNQLGLPSGHGAAAEVAAPKVEMDGGAVSKVFLIGRERKVIVEGRNRYVTIKGQKVSITKAREMDKKFKADKKAKEAKKAAKK